MSWASETIENQNTSFAHFDSTYSWLMVKSWTVRPVLWKLEIFQCTEWMNNIFTEPFLTLLEVFLSDLMAWRVDCGFAQPNGCGLAGDDWSISCLLLTCEDRIYFHRRIKNSEVHAFSLAFQRITGRQPTCNMHDSWSTPALGVLDGAMAQKPTLEV